MATLPVGAQQAWKRYHSTRSVEDRNVLVELHFELVRFVANKMVSKTRDREIVNVDDLMSEGTIGLIQAVERFDLEGGAAFSTFAVRRIRGSMLDYFRSMDNLTRRERRVLSAALEVGGSAPEHQLNPVHYDAFESQPAWLDVRVSEDDFAEIELESLVQEILEFLRVRKPRHYEIAVLTSQGKTLKEIGDRLGCTESNVSRLRLQTQALVHAVLDGRVRMADLADMKCMWVKIERMLATQAA